MQHFISCTVVVSRKIKRIMLLASSFRRSLCLTLIIGFSAALSCAWVPLAAAQTAYPNKPIRLIVPFPAGGSVDVTSRALAQKLSEQLGQQVIVDNRPGAGGNIGMDAVAKSRDRKSVV